MKRIISFFLCTIFLCSLCACSVQEISKEIANSNYKTSPSEISSDTSAPMGRWVESVVSLPYENLNIISAPTELKDGTLCLFAEGVSTNTDGTGIEKMHKFISSDFGITWSEDEIAYEELTNEKVQNVVLSREGSTLFNLDFTVDEQGETFLSFWYSKNADTPEKFTFNRKSEQYGRVLSYGFVGEETLYVIANSIQTSGGDFIPGKVLMYDIKNGEQIVCVENKEGTLSSLSTDQNMIYYLSYLDGGIRTLCTIDKSGVTNEIFKSIPNSNGTTASFIDDDGNFYFANASGFFRIASAGSLVEKLFDSNSFVLSQVRENYYLKSISLSKNGEYFALIPSMENDYGYILYRYYFDESLPLTNTAQLSVWSLRDDATLRATIVEFNKAHNDITVDYTVAMSDNETALTKEDIIRALNTELLAGNGPDVIVFDGFDYSSYINKNMLADLASSIDFNLLLPNISSPFIKDGKAYVLPARFSVPIVYGESGSVESLTSLDALQAAILACAPRQDQNMEDSKYYEEIPPNERYALAFLSIEHLLHFALQSSAPALIKDNKLDQDALQQLLKFVKAVSDHYSMANYRKDQKLNGIVGGGVKSDIVEMWDGYYEYSALNHAKYGWDIMKTPAFLGYVGRFDKVTKSTLNGNAILQPGLVKGAYLPSSLVGVNANSKNIELSMSFVKDMFGAPVQDGFYQNGTPVLQSSFDKSMLYNDAQVKSKYFTGDGVALYKSLQTPVIIDNIVEAKLLEHTIAFCNGKRTLDEAITDIKNSLAIYLAEKE